MLKNAFKIKFIFCPLKIVGFPFAAEECSEVQLDKTELRRLCF